jgi:hypothetical protein
MSGLTQAQPTFDVVWIHPRGTSLHQIVTEASGDGPPGVKPVKVFTQRPATLASVLSHIQSNKMFRSKSDISYWVGSGVDVFFYPPPDVVVGAVDSTAKAQTPNIAVDALLLKLSLDDLSISSFAVQPHGLCLCVAKGVIPDSAEHPSVPTSLKKETILKILTFTGQLGPVQGDKKKMETAKHHWKW